MRRPVAKRLYDQVHMAPYTIKLEPVVSKFEPRKTRSQWIGHMFG